MATPGNQHEDDGHGIAVTEHHWIPMPDGVRLAARLWLPTSAEKSPVPALLEYIPYRKTDMVRARDERNHPFFAANGYACLRVDMRGSGDSEGLMPDMYTDNELSDARHVIEWIAAQPWCSGSVGMFGTSWGGTTALQANIDAPNALKAVIAVCATHDRYADDIHIMGGCLLTDTFEWGATLPAILAAPPTPNVGSDWKRQWQHRLDHLAFPVENWVREETCGDYWRHGSVIHQADRLSRPILAVGGWSDRYSNSVMSLVSARPDLTWGIVGPWGHHYPDQGKPGPAIGFQELALEWWDHWLKDSAAATMWPRLRVWLRTFDAPADSLETREGHWIETGTAASESTNATFTFGTPALAAQTQTDSPWHVPSDVRVGRAAGDTGYFGRHGGLPLEQSDDDAAACVFETQPMDEDQVIYGPPIARLCVAAFEPLSQIAIRLVDVAPDGTAALICRTVRALEFDDEFRSAEADGQSEITFPNTAYRLKQGHRLRVSLSTSYWPLIWPAPHTEALTLTSGQLDVPIFNGTPQALTTQLPPPTDHSSRQIETIAAPPLVRTATLDTGGSRTDGWHQPETAVKFHETDTLFAYETRAAYQIGGTSVQSARATFTHTVTYDRPDGRADISSTLDVSTSGTDLKLSGHLVATWDDDLVKSRSWKRRIPCKHR